MATILKGLGVGSATSALKVHNIPQAVVMGYGSKAISKIITNLAGPLIPSFSFTLPVVNVSISVLDVVRYFLHGGQLSLSASNLNPLIATLLPIMFPNPTGYTAAMNVPAPGYTGAYGG